MVGAVVRFARGGSADGGGFGGTGGGLSSLNNSMSCATSGMVIKFIYIVVAF